MVVSGTVIASETQKGTSKAGREWQKKTFVIEFMEGTYTKRLAFELFGEDRINNNPFRKGQAVTVNFDIESSEWNGRWFTTLNAWKVSKLDPTATPGVSQEVEVKAAPEMIPQSKSEELPF